MKHALSYTAGIIGLAIGSLASTAFAQTTANGPYYATPSWDQALPASTRFIVLANLNSEAVLDRETGIVWTGRARGRSSSVALAANDCVTAFVGGRAGWRLPSIQELMSLVGPITTAALLENDLVTQQAGFVVWSSTVSGAFFNLPYAIQKDNFTGAWKADTSGSTSNAFWCVRSPAPGDKVQ